MPPPTWAANPREGVLDDVAGGPGRGAAGDLAHESPQDFAALQGMGYLGMELDRVESARLIGHGGDRRIIARGDCLESRGHRDDVVAVAHPHVEHAPARRVAIVFQRVQQARGGGWPNLCGAEFAPARALDLAAQLGGHGLHAVADAEHWYAHLEHVARRLQALGVVHRLGAAREDHRPGVKGLDRGRIRIAGVDLAIDAEFAYAAGDQLGVLGAEIEDQDPISVDVEHQLIR